MAKPVRGLGLFIMKMKLPDGVALPEGTKSGDTFKCMDTWKLGSDGKCELVAIQDEPVDESSSKKGFVTSYEDAMKG